MVFWTTAKQAADAAADGDSSSSSAAAAAGASGTSPAGSKKKVRKLQQQAQQALAGAQGSTGMLQAGYLYPDLITRLEFTEDLEYLVGGTGCCVCMCEGGGRGKEGRRGEECSGGKGRGERQRGGHANRQQARGSSKPAGWVVLVLLV